MGEENSDREVLLSRRAILQGYRLMKSPGNDPDEDGNGGYMLVDDDTKLVVCGVGSSSYTADLDEIEQLLDEG